MLYDWKKSLAGVTNFIFIGGTGSGKTEIALNFARELQKLGEKEVHFFDMDMTKPLFRSRDAVAEMEKLGVFFHYQLQFMDSPTLVGGVQQKLRKNDYYTVLDVGGDANGARTLGSFSSLLNGDNTVLYYVFNAFRPWSDNIDHVDATYAEILGVSRLQGDRVHMVGNHHLGCTTTAEEVLEGHRQMTEILSPYKDTDFLCVRSDLIDSVKPYVQIPLMPLELYMTYEWLEED